MISNHSGFGRALFWLLCLCVILTKIFLVAGNEIIAVPNDSAVFVRHVLQGVGQLGAPSGYPLWLWVVKVFGVPQRIAIEILYLMSCLCLSLSIRRSGGSLLSLFLFFALALSPVTYHLFDNALSDPLYICLGFFALSISILLFQSFSSEGRRVWVFGVGLGGVLGLMGWVRNEGVLLFGWLLFLFALSAAFLWRACIVKEGWRRFFFVATISVVSFFFVNGIPSAYHYFSKGVWTNTLASMPSHMRLLNNLAKIDADEKNIKHVTISKRARSLAYEASPTLALLREHIERADNMYVDASHRVAGLPLGEIGVGWVWHVFNDAALAVMPNPKTEKALDDLWVRANEEIEEAFENGRLKERFVFHPFVAAGVIAPFNNFSGGVSVALDKVFQFYPRQVDQRYAEEAFNEVCNRRATFVSVGGQGRYKLQGWVFPANKRDDVLGVQVGFRQGNSKVTEWIDLERRERPDVDAAFSKELGGAVSSYGFFAEIDRPANSDISLRYISSAGVVLEPSFRANSIEKLNAGGGGVLYRGMDLLDVTRPVSEVGARMMVQEKVMSSVAWTWAKWPLLCTAALAFFAALFLLLRGRVGERSVVLFAAAFAFSLAAMRVFFYALINENSWEIEPRYMSPVFGILVVASFCFIAELFRLVGGGLRKRTFSS